ncbi:unnamed protein product [Didymodactylos carnosus]|uniref:NADPH--cytochrome P450 reductase n=1 Tax=Didymodactylos carnosus TaxID=1234261 RepID=A0A813NX66_9BILA|nr:unnamed protein product [Didymodactylos carnosus]CAF3525266.1 unnamed protein product [Didymodactylos carnosus]
MTVLINDWFDSKLSIQFAIYGILTTILSYCLWWRGRKTVESPVIQAIQTLPTKIGTTNGSFVDRMLHGNKTMVLFYGSQTGTAEDFAQRLAKQAKRYGIAAMVVDPEETEMEDLQRLVTIENHLAVFTVATYGEGDPTDNAQEFYEWLRQDANDLNGLHYAVFGLGNKTYEYYNAVGKYVDRRLSELGAVRVAELGMGDDDGNIEDDFIAWSAVFWKNVCQKYRLVRDTDESTMRQYKLIKDIFPQETIFTGEVGRLKCYEKQKSPFHLRNPFLAPILANKELFKPDSLRSCLHLELDLTNSRLSYETGDHVAIFPTNDSYLVNHIGELLGVDLDEVISLVDFDEDAQKKNPFPCPCSYRTALTHYLDITSVPNTQILKDIAQYATDESERALLTLMGSYSEDGRIKYKDWALDGCRSIVVILEDLPSLKPPLEYLCEVLPRLQARYYSISSSSKIYPTSVHLTAVVVQYLTPTQRIAKGVATNQFRRMYLKEYDPKPIFYDNNNNDETSFCYRLPIYIRKSTFRLPFKFQTPIIMIGPGTGLAPFRGFIQERHFQKIQGKPVGETILYYGCRKRDEDFLYEDELKYYESEKTLELHVAFSRDQEHKVYVTHLLRLDGEKLWKLIINNNANLYVCGDAKHMSRDVQMIIVDIAQLFGGLTSEGAMAFVKDLIVKGRYSQDVWS